MPGNSKLAGIVSIGTYTPCAYLILWWYTMGDIFCRSHFAITARLTFAFTVWYLIIKALGELLKNIGLPRVPLAALKAAVVAVGIASIPFWLYRGYGYFLLENTSADVNCAFREGYGMVFPFVVAPLFFVLCLICEALAVQLTKRSQPKI